MDEITRRMPFSTSIDQRNEFRIKKNYRIRFLNHRFINLFILIQAGIRILAARKREKRLGGSETEIIQQIHNLRYADENSYVTTGGHFSQLYVRNVGIFLNTLLDPRIPSSDEDWTKRQSIVLKTVALDLEVFKQAKKTYTTIVHLWKNFYTTMNIYTHPSDSLFGILYTLRALKDENFIPFLFPAPDAKVTVKKKLQTKDCAKSMIKEYKETLLFLLNQYRDSVIDNKTGLIRKDMYLASARDGIKRQSSFYDNVICWSTFYLAHKLAILSIPEKEMNLWKKRIMTNYWNKEKGIFLDDLSKESMHEKKFCADSFIVMASGFFDMRHPTDRKKLQSMIAYVQKNKLDFPFPLHYSKKNDITKLYWPVRFGATSYMGETIWSHWGMEYIKTLILLSPYKKDYLNQAKKYIEAYKQNITSYGGYPELYDTKGKLYTTTVYRGVLHNSWIINYEQVKMLLHLYTPHTLARTEQVVKAE